MKIIYDVIKRPLFTEKGLDMKEKENKILIEVNPQSNKHEIKNAIESIFKVKVEKIATINERGKTKRLGRYIGKTSDRKKAIITLKKGEKLDFIEGI